MNRIAWVASLIMLTACGAAAANAQNNAASPDDVARCVDWMKNVVPLNMRISPAAFCAGIKPDGSPDGFYSVQNCGPAFDKNSADSHPYCASSGIVGPDWTLAVGYSAASGNGNEFFTEWEKGNSIGASTSLYTRTPLRIGTMRAPAGFYRVMPVKADQNWKLAVTREGKSLGTVDLTTDTEHLSSTAGSLAIAVYHSATRCHDPINTRELVFTYNGADLYVCLQPEPIPSVARQTAAR